MLEGTLLARSGIHVLAAYPILLQCFNQFITTAQGSTLRRSNIIKISESKAQAVTSLAFDVFHAHDQVEPVSSFFAEVTCVPRCNAKTRSVINKLSKLPLYHHETIA